jgi:uncharacterized membrane protein YdjX (TVP38/TMEM64 family)
MTAPAGTRDRGSQRARALLGNRRIWIVIAIVIVVVALRMTGIDQLLSLDTLRAHRQTLVAWVDAHVILVSAAYVLIYVGAVAFSLPGAVYLTLAGGFLFGAIAGAALTVVGATVGAIVVFLFARALFGDRVIDRLAAQYPGLVTGTRENAWSYLLVLRFVPLFPFFLVNLVAALAGVRFATYAVTTFLGIIPGTSVYSLTGAGLGSVLDQGGTVSAGSVLNPTVIAALVGLALLSLAAIPIRRKFAGLTIACPRKGTHGQRHA